jgi:hypothetical protein
MKQESGEGWGEGLSENNFHMVLSWVPKTGCLTKYVTLGFAPSPNPSQREGNKTRLRSVPPA